MSDEQGKSPEYLQGFTAGYQRRVREELESWRAVIEGGHLVAFGEIIRTVPFAEREQQRLDLVKAAHDAGIHGHSARGCPWCADSDDTARCPFCDAGPYATPRWLRGHIDEAHAELLRDDAAWDRHHNGDYGVRCAFHSALPDAPVDAPDCPGCQHESGGAQNPAYGVGPDLSQRVFDEVAASVCVCGGQPTHTRGPCCMPGPAPCKRHAGEGNQLNCADCGRRRKDFYDRIALAGEPDPCAGGCSNPALHAEGGHDV